MSMQLIPPQHDCHDCDCRIASPCSAEFLGINCLGFCVGVLLLTGYHPRIWTDFSMKVTNGFLAPHLTSPGRSQA